MIPSLLFSSLEDIAVPNQNVDRAKTNFCFYVEIYAKWVSQRYCATALELTQFEIIWNNCCFSNSFKEHQFQIVLQQYFVSLSCCWMLRLRMVHEKCKKKVPLRIEGIFEDQHLLFLYDQYIRTRWMGWCNAFRPDDYLCLAIISYSLGLVIVLAYLLRMHDQDVVRPLAHASGSPNLFALLFFRKILSFLPYRVVQLTFRF